MQAKGESSLNGFKFDIFAGHSPSEGAASMTVKGLNVHYAEGVLCHYDVGLLAVGQRTVGMVAWTFGSVTVEGVGWYGWGWGWGWRCSVQVLMQSFSLPL